MTFVVGACGLELAYLFLSAFATCSGFAALFSDDAAGTCKIEVDTFLSMGWITVAFWAAMIPALGDAFSSLIALWNRALQSTLGLFETFGKLKNKGNWCKLILPASFLLLVASLCLPQVARVNMQRYNSLIYSKIQWLRLSLYC